MGAYLVSRARLRQGRRGFDRARGLREGCADLLPGVQRLLGRIRPGGPPARARNQPKVSIDSAKDFYELTQLKIATRRPAC